MKQGGWCRYNPFCMYLRKGPAAIVIFIFLAVVGSIAWWWVRGRLPATQTGASPPEVESSAGPLTEWYYADGIVSPEDTPLAKRRQGSWSPSREWIVLLNLGNEACAATATFFFESSPPRRVSRSLPARGSTYIVVHELSDVVPPGQLYGVRILSSGPVIVQPTRGEYERDNPVTKAMSSFVAYPGPLGKRETKWAYADSLVLHSEGPLEEREWITILNPNRDREASVKIRFLFDGSERTHQLTVPAERVKTVDLFELGLPPRNRLSGLVSESDVPVVVEQVRRAFIRGVPVVQSMWACLAHPIGNQEGP